MTARLLLVDDHNLFRTGLRLIVQDHAGVGEIAEAGSIAEACALQAVDTDLVLLDIQLPGMNGLDGLRPLRQACPRARIVLVSASVAPDAIHEARARGADGFLFKSASAQDILDAITCALAGQPCFPTHNRHGAAARAPDAPSLTARQLEVLALLCTGKPNKVIARDLGLSENTVRVHVAAIFAQLGVNSRSAALLAAQRMGLSTPQLHDTL
ncbi:MAG: response regulator transcription factor [Comamonadaceae bacterium]|nr:MAG: response regulator transcription factor [Comamonadaceae bacterium]